MTNILAAQRSWLPGVHHKMEKSKLGVLFLLAALTH